MSLTWLDPEDTRKRRPLKDLPLFEESGLSTELFGGVQCETEEGAPTVSALRPTHSSDIAHARRSDPQTSHDAAKSVVNLGRVRDAIIQLFKAFPRGMTDEQLIYFYRETQKVRRDFKDATDSGIRSRRADLVRLGFLEDSGNTGRTAADRPCTIWRLCK